MNVLPELADYAVGDTVTLTCLKATRYTLFGDKEVSCLSGGDWSDSPYCRKTGTVLGSCHKPHNILISKYP